MPRTLHLFAVAVPLLFLLTVSAAFAEAPEKELGRLSLNAAPWAIVSIDAKNVGSTPRTIELKPGPYTVVFRANGVAETRHVTVEAAKTSKLFVKMPPRKTRPSK